MKPAAFRYHRPASLDAALGLLARFGESARPIAGGQSLVPMMNLRMAQPAELIDLSRISSMREVRESPEWLEIGAMVRHHEIEHSPQVKAACALLSTVAASIGHYAIRQRGTLGGSMAHADPAAQWPLLAVALNAEICAVGPSGERCIPARSFFQSLMTTALGPDELLTAVRFPRLQSGEGWSYQAFSRRSGDFAIIAVASTLRIEAGRVSRLRLAVGGAGPVPLALDSLELAQRNEHANAEWAARMGSLARKQCQVADDARIPAIYREELIETLVSRALLEALGRAGVEVGQTR